MKKLSFILTILLLFTLSNYAFAQTNSNEEIYYGEIHCVQIYWKYCPNPASELTHVEYKFVNHANDWRTVEYTIKWSVGSNNFSHSFKQRIGANTTLDYNSMSSDFLDPKYCKLENSAKFEVTSVTNNYNFSSIIDSCSFIKKTNDVTQEKPNVLQSNYYITKADGILKLKISECEKLNQINQLSWENRDDKKRTNKELNDGFQYISKVYGEQQKKCDSESNLNKSKDTLNGLTANDIDGEWTFTIIEYKTKWTCDNKEKENELDNVSNKINSSRIGKVYTYLLKLSENGLNLTIQGFEYKKIKANQYIREWNSGNESFKYTIMFENYTLRWVLDVSSCSEDHILSSNTRKVWTGIKINK